MVSSAVIRQFQRVEACSRRCCGRQAPVFIFSVTFALSCAACEQVQQLALWPLAGHAGRCEVGAS